MPGVVTEVRGGAGQGFLCPLQSSCFGVSNSFRAPVTLQIMCVFQDMIEHDLEIQWRTTINFYFTSVLFADIGHARNHSTRTRQE